jgi:hypothetical protein
MSWRYVKQLRAAALDYVKKREREGGRKAGKGKERESFKKLAKVAISNGVPG